MKKKYIIIGGIAGGISAAARLRRLDENASITVIEKKEHVAIDRNALPYCIGMLVSVKDLTAMQSQEEILARYGIEVKLNCEVTAINRHQKAIAILDLNTDKTYQQHYDKLVIASGTTPVLPEADTTNIKKIFTLKDLSNLSEIMANIDTYNVRRAAIIGGGIIGLEVAVNLSSRGIKTCVIEQSSHPLPSFDADMAQLARRALEDNSVALITHTTVVEFESTEEGIRLTLSGDRSIFSDIVILCTGVTPETTLAKKAGLGIGVTSGILVDERLQTTDKDIYAVGNAVETESIFGGKKLISMAPAAIKQGRIAADNICGINSKFKQVLSVSIVRVFDTHMASAGLTEQELQDKEIRYEKIYLSGFSRESYYPGKKPIILKLIFEKKTGKILGVQIVGEEGIDKRIDVLATAMRAGFTADKLADLELAYAPSFSPASDIINIAGYMASDVMNGLTDVVQWHDVKSLKNAILLDVRTNNDAATLFGAVHIPFRELRHRMNELPKEKDIVVFCADGHLSYLAERILKQNGYRVKTLCGGYTLFKIFNRKG